MENTISFVIKYIDQDFNRKWTIINRNSQPSYDQVRNLLYKKGIRPRIILNWKSYTNGI